ncbi:MAG: tetratricopeptide repeat protein [Candidatus Promineifilaceae bacterium]
MSRIALRDYLDQIAALIDESRLDEAAAHCRNILEQHPRHMPTYELLGKALLEMKNFEEAVDIFLRVLSADPENIISHAGLAIAYASEEDYRRATWHMERAYDIDPYNQAISAELIELYRNRDGAAPDSLQMTRAALARLYIRGALYDSAAKELEQLLMEQPDREDLHVMLAETYYRHDKRKEAKRKAEEILADLPLCIKANAILAGLWSASGRPDRAKQHLMRVRTVLLPQAYHLAEDTLVAEVLLKIENLQLPKQIAVEELDYVPPARAAVEEDDSFTAAADGESDDALDMEDWLREMSSGLDQ